jgi:hypothetical protein
VALRPNDLIDLRLIPVGNRNCRLLVPTELGLELGGTLAVE